MGDSLKQAARFASDFSFRAHEEVLAFDYTLGTLSQLAGASLPILRNSAPLLRAYTALTEALFEVKSDQIRSDQIW